MTSRIHPDFIADKNALSELIGRFHDEGEFLGEPVRNTIKIFPWKEARLNIKSFKEPHFANRIIYRYFRKSKARRSYEYACRLLEMKVGTPEPVAYFENSDVIGLRDSYYISRQLEADLMFRELTTNPDYPEIDEILRQYARFIFGVHEKGIEFIDNTSGNTLIRKRGDQYDFYLVDLNRMRFGQDLSLERRIANIAKLTSQPHVISIIAKEYAKCAGKDEKTVLAMLEHEAMQFQERFVRRRQIKKRLKFWE